MAKVSIIVPTYNREKTLPRCIESVLNQSFRDFEFIIVDDGSRDNTEEVVRGYQDERIRYFKRTNHGIGASRNFGVEQSKGEYIGFIDSDDYYDLTFIEKMLGKAVKDECDLVVCDFNQLYSDGSVRVISTGDFPDSSLRDNPMLLMGIQWNPWNKLYKRELLVNNPFPTDRKYEDLQVVVKAAALAKKIGRVNEPLNYYIFDNPSETSVRDERVFDLFKVLDDVRDTLSDEAYREVRENIIVQVLTNHTIQQRYNKNREVRNSFIHHAFQYMRMFAPGYRNCAHLKSRGFAKALVEKNELITLIYDELYALTH